MLETLYPPVPNHHYHRQDLLYHFCYTYNEVQLLNFMVSKNYQIFMCLSNGIHYFCLQHCVITLSFFYI